MAAVTAGEVLAVNAGSTSVKLSRFAGNDELPAPDSLDAALDAAPPAAVVHRVVHGGEHTAAALLDEQLLAELRDLGELAPLHQPAALEAIDRCRAAWPHARQVACFDTAFHTTLPPDARTYALPADLRARVRVYGFHGLSHAWSARRAAATVPGARRVLVAHLGGGQSLCGVLDGRSVVTTMGFTPLDGLVMATRSGTVDTSALLYLARHTDADLDDVLETRSGLLGLAGTGDMREVLSRRRAGDADAQLALDVWLHRFLRHAGGCVAVLGGLDVLVFTGGIGEQSDEIRDLVAGRLAWLGVALDPAAVPGSDVADVAAPDARVRTLVVHAREDRQMLDEAAPLLDDGGPTRNQPAVEAP